MGRSSQIKGDFKKLNKFVNGFGEKRVVKIGVFGATSRENERKGQGKLFSANDGGGHSKGTSAASLTNADVGAIHELGSFTKGIPARSWLRMPLHQQTTRILKDARRGAAELLARGEVVKVLARLGEACDAAIQRAFNTGGFGLWKELKAATIRRKHSTSQLIDTAQLRKSITYKVDAPS